MKKLLLLIIIILLKLNANNYNQTIHICDDENEWPPFTYYKRIDGHKDKQHLTGAMTEFLNVIFKKIGTKYTLTLMPWKRCTYLVYSYKKASKKYEMFINGTYNKDRAKKYYISKPVYFTYQAVFYSKNKYPNGIIHNGKWNINKYKICDVNGYNINSYYTKLGLKKSKKIDQEAGSFESVLKKISVGRCDLVVASEANIYGAEKIGKYKIPKDIASQRIPNLKPTAFYIFISKDYPNAKKLLKEINKAIDELKKDGTYKRIFTKYNVY